MNTKTFAATAGQNIHVWEAGGAASAEALTAWVNARLAAHESALAALLAVEGERTPENSLPTPRSQLKTLFSSSSASIPCPSQPPFCPISMLSSTAAVT